MTTRGLYIVLEGPDGVGKTTQAELLAAYLESQNKRAIHIKEPGGTPIGEAIRGVLLDSSLDRTPMTNLLLFTANRHELWFNKIKPALEQGSTVIATRNYWSSVVFQGYGEGMSTSVIQAVTSTFSEQAYMKPDIGIILNFKDATVLKTRLRQRGALDIFESKPADFQERVIKGYDTIAEQYNATVVDASGSIETVHEAVVDAVRERVTLFDLATDYQ